MLVVSVGQKLSLPARRTITSKAAFEEEIHSGVQERDQFLNVAATRILSVSTRLTTGSSKILPAGVSHSGGPLRPARLVQRLRPGALTRPSPLVVRGSRESPDPHDLNSPRRELSLTTVARPT